jgi:hypothetical protein
VPVRWLIVTSLLIGIAIAIAWLSIHAPRGVVLLKHFKEYLDALQNDEHKRIGSIIFDSYNEYRTDARNWSAVTFGSLFLSAALSACAGVILKLEFFLRNEHRSRLSPLNEMRGLVSAERNDRTIPSKSERQPK